MKTLLRSTTAYALYSAQAARGEVPHTALILFPDPVYLRALLKECAKAFFRAEEGSRTAVLIDKECYSDCRILPAAGEKLTADGASEIVEESMLRPVEGDKKLFVLDTFESAAALVQNKLLKVLEEPPAGVFFLLGATAEHAVLPTVLSRAEKLSVPPFSEERIEEALRRGHAQEKGIREAAVASGGIYSVAETLLAGGDDFRLAEDFLRGKDLEILCRKLGERKEKKSFFAAVRLMLRDLLFQAVHASVFVAGRVPGDLAAAYPAGVCLAALEFTADAERDLLFNANAGQAAYTLALRIREEQKKWQTLS